MRHFAKHLVLLSSIAVYTTANAQTGAGFSDPKSNQENAPYSRFGLGELRNGTNLTLRGMGSATSAYSNPFAVNTYNPASYASLALTTFEGAGEGSIRTIQAANAEYRTGMATLSYINIGIPLGKNGGMALGLRPYSRVYYRMQDTLAEPGIGNAIRGYQGEGAINYAFLGGAYKFKGISLGFNFGYMFGTIRTSSILEENDVNYVLNSEFTRSTKVGGIYWGAGAMYEQKLNDKLMLTIGGAANLSQDLNAWRDDYWLSYRYSSAVSGGRLTDTAYSVNELKGEMTLPLSYSFGVQLAGENKWNVLADYSSSQWSEFRNYGQPDSLTNAYKLAVGGSLTPDAASLNSYLSRVTYRVGFYYGKDIVRLRNTDINYYAVTLGASLPFKRSTDRIHTSFEIGSRGTQVNGLLRETFVKFGLGISLNDKWFIQRKYD